MAYLLSFILFIFTASPLAAWQTEEDAILQLSNKKFEWLIHQQTDSLALYLDDQLMYIHSNGMIETKEELITNNKSGQLVYHEVELTDARVRFEKDTAVLTAQCRLHAAMGENVLKTTLFITEVYVLKNNRWLLFSRHASRTP